MTKRSLPKVSEAQQKLGLPTIMDRTLAQAHGAKYVHLAVFAIDVDRVYWLDPERDDLPFGWEVFLTECLLLTQLDAHTPEGRELIEGIISDLLEETPGEPPLGGQLAFAVFDAILRYAWPNELLSPFRAWRSRPADLASSLDALFAACREQLPALAQHCLSAELSPPLAPPTQQILQAMTRGELAPPAPPATDSAAPTDPTPSDPSDPSPSAA